MKDGGDLDDVVAQAVDDSVATVDDLADRFVAKLRHDTSRAGVVHESFYSSDDPVDDKIAVDVDTVGADTVITPLGLFHCVKVSFRQGKNNSHDFGDSTQYDEAWDKRMKYLSRQIPITSLARQEMDVSYQRRKWQIGRSENAPPLQYLDHSIAEARVVGFGSGMKSRILPESMQKSLPRKAAVAAPTRKARPSATKKSG